MNAPFPSPVWLQPGDEPPSLCQRDHPEPQQQERQVGAALPPVVPCHPHPLAHAPAPAPSHLCLCRTKALVLELLAAVCLVRGGHDIILAAFDNFKEVSPQQGHPLPT